LPDAKLFMLALATSIILLLPFSGFLSTGWHPRVETDFFVSVATADSSDIY